MVSTTARKFSLNLFICAISVWLTATITTAYLLSFSSTTFSSFFLSNAYAEPVSQTNNQMIANNVPSLFFASYSPVLGNPKGNVSLVTFMDYQCGYCKKQAHTLLAMLGDKNLRVVVKELPVLGPASEQATRAALAAKQQGKYAQMHEALMSTTMPLTEANILTLARSIHLNIEQLQNDMQSTEVDSEIQRNKELAAKLGIVVTPAIIVVPTPSYGRDGWHVQFNAMTFSLGYANEAAVRRALAKAHQQ